MVVQALKVHPITYDRRKLNKRDQLHDIVQDKEMIDIIDCL